MTEKRKPGWAFWTTVALIVVAMYVASVGPAVYIRIKAGDSEIAERAFDVVYAPLIFLCKLTAETRFAFIGNWLEENAEWWDGLAEP